MNEQIVIDNPPDLFTGTGDVKGFTFEKVKSNEKAFIYKVTIENKTHWEVFLAKKVNKCIDFMKKIYSETHFKYSYPKTKDFGSWAWVELSLKEAEKRFVEICKE